MLNAVDKDPVEEHVKLTGLKNSPSCSDTLSEIESPSDSDGRSKISIGKYEEQWLLFKEDVSKLSKMALEGELRACRFRSLCWSIFLNIVGKDASQWASEMSACRKLYYLLAAQYEASPWSHTTDGRDHPLSQDEESIWCQYFENVELQKFIQQDVIRTFPGIDFFHTPEVQDTMTKILFLYARKNHNLCYRQGMHEILAPILFVLHCDHEAFAHAREMGFCDSDLMAIFDPSHLAADAYSIFFRVMANLESSYIVPKLPSAKSDIYKERDSEISERLDFISNHLLKKEDPKLALHLEMLDIPLHLFGIRWLRLLFGREFPLQDLLILWDVIFSTEDFQIVDYIVVAMLVAIRNLLLGPDYVDCLTCLMRYPLGVDLSYVVQYSFYLMNPSEYPKLPTSIICPPLEERGHRKTRNKASVAVKQPDAKKRKFPQQPEKSYPEVSIPQYSQDEEIERLRAVIGVTKTKISQYHEILREVVLSCNNLEAHQALEGLHQLTILLNGSIEDPEIEAAYEAGEEERNLLVGVANKEVELKVLKDTNKI